MCKAVQDSRILAEFLDRKTVVFLIQEKSCLLSVLDIDLIFHSIFDNLNKSRELRSDEALVKFHSFLLADFGITSLVDSTDVDSVLCKNFPDKFEDHFFPAVDSKCKGLYDQNILKFVNCQARQEICLTKDQAAA